MPRGYCNAALAILLIAVVVLNSSTAAAAAAAAGNASENSNWPQWRGPLGSGEAPSADPPTTWAEGKNVRWKVKLPGRGTSTPIIWGDSIFIQAAISMPKPAGGPAAALPID